LRARKEGEKAGGAIVFAPPANNSHLISPHTRMYLTIGITMLASLVLFCVVIFRRDSAVNFIESHPLPILVLVSLASILRLWVELKSKTLKAGIFLRSFGRFLIIFAVGAIFLLNLPSAVTLTCFALGFVSSIIGAMQFRAARRLERDAQPQK
jgi:FtsH-binding integral membrane protein